MVSRNKSSVFEKDFDLAKDLFPKLTYGWNAEGKAWVVTGELDICDVKGDYWNTFDIAILVGESYPYCIPAVFEKSELIPRDIDWHISKEGQCCVDADNKLLAMSRSGINFKDFMTSEVYPFFANQIYKLDTTEYAGEEYKHFADGVLQYYMEELQIPSSSAVIIILEAVLSKADLTRNKLCPCGSGKKIKKCHESAIETIKRLGREKVNKDLLSIQKWLSDHSDKVN